MPVFLLSQIVPYLDQLTALALTVASSLARKNAQGRTVTSGRRCIGYLTKDLTKHVADCHQAPSPAQHEHAERLADALRYESAEQASDLGRSGESGRRESNPHDQLGRLGLYH